MKLSNLAGLEGLLNLDRQGVDIRPTLLRVITDQYLQTAVHTPDEDRQFTELALRLLDETEIPTRAAVATRLAHHASAPRPIILQLARDVLDVAEPILLHAPGLTPADLETIAAERGPSYAEIIARRGTPQPAEQPASPQASVLRAPVKPQREPAALEIAFAPPLVAEPPPPTSAAAAQSFELCEIFFAAGAEERRLILVTLDHVPIAPDKVRPAMQRNDIWRLESAALQHNSEAVAHDLERALGISRRVARRIVNDELGDPIVVAAKAMALPADVLQRMLLFMNPRVGQSVDRVYQLAALYEEITAEAACHLVEIWQEADPVDSEAPAHEAQWQDTVQSARHALSEISRRQPARTELPPLAPPRRATG
jgi:hypothetical protein